MPGTPNTSTIDLSISTQVGRRSTMFYINLATLTDAAQLVWTPGYIGRLIATKFHVHVPVTTAAKLSTLTPSIAGTNVSGGVLALTSANCTPRGAIVSGTTVTAANEFTAAQAITITGSATTAFVEGTGWLELVTVNDDDQNAVALASGGLRSANPS